MRIFNIADALTSLVPTGNFCISGRDITYAKVDWQSDLTMPSEAEIDAEIVRLQAEYDALAYSRKREAEYPSVQECVHAILDDTLDALQAKRAEIKTKYPKGG